MANSIANLAVVISGHTKPLEEAMKKAQSKVGGFSHSIKEGFGLGLGVMGLDKLEGAMKKAIADMPQLAEAADKAEKSFGRMLLKVTGIGWLLPKAATILEDVSDWLDGITPEMKKQLALQETMLKNERLLVDTRLEGMGALIKSLEAQMDAIDPMREQLRIAEQLKKENDPYMSKNITLEQMSRPDYDPFAREKALAMKAEIEEHNRVMAAMDEEIAKIEEEKQEYEEWLKMYNETIKTLDEYQEPFGPITKMQAELEKKNALIAEGRELLLSQVPAVEQLRKKYEEAQKAGLTGDELKAFEKAYKDAKLQQDQANVIPVQLGGAATAGSDAAYSIIANAQANTIKPEMQAQTKELKSQTQLLTQIKDNTPKPGDFAFGIYRMEL